MEKNSQSFYYHADGLGSIAELTNQFGAVAQRYTYSSFGKLESHSEPSVAQPYTFTSRELDAESGLHYFRNRYYNSTTGRFVGEDPKGFGAGVNFYGYVDGNPVTRVDPYGLDWLTDISNFSAGVGDYLSGGFLGQRATPISRFLRQELLATIGLNDIVDQCSTAYSAGSYTGFALGTVITWSAGLNAGGGSVPWSGFNEGAKAIAEQIGTTVGKTQIGHVLETLQYTYNLRLPSVAWQGIWAIASATFAGNATGPVQAVIRNAGWVWQYIEKPILTWRNIPINFVQ
jgi:RHS repeat-associated protein